MGLLLCILFLLSYALFDYAIRKTGLRNNKNLRKSFTEITALTLPVSYRAFFKEGAMRNCPSGLAKACYFLNISAIKLPVNSIDRQGRRCYINSICEKLFCSY
jgi:ABC-type arginine/histidine transport system permease subunit